MTTQAMLEKWQAAAKKLVARMRKMDRDAERNNGFGDQGGYMLAELELTVIRRVIRDLKATLRTAAGEPSAIARHCRRALSRAAAHLRTRETHAREVGAQVVAETYAAAAVAVEAYPFAYTPGESAPA